MLDISVDDVFKFLLWQTFDQFKHVRHPASKRKASAMEHAAKGVLAYQGVSTSATPRTPDWWLSRGWRKVCVGGLVENMYIRADCERWFGHKDKE